MLWRNTVKKKLLNNNFFIFLAQLKKNWFWENVFQRYVLYANLNILTQMYKWLNKLLLAVSVHYGIKMDPCTKRRHKMYLHAKQ